MDHIENDQRSRKIDDEQKSQKFMSQTLLERDSQMLRNFDEFAGSSKLANNFNNNAGYSQRFRFEPRQMKRQLTRGQVSQENQNLLAFSRAEIRRENSISEILSEEESGFFHAVPMTEPVDQRQFNSEVSSYGKVLESIIGSDSLLGDQSSLYNQESQGLHRFNSGLQEKKIPKLKHLKSMNQPSEPRQKVTNNIYVGGQDLQHDYQPSYGSKIHRDGFFEAKRSDDSLTMFEYGKQIDTRKIFQAPRSVKGSNRTNDQAQVLKYATKSLLENKTEGVKKIVLHKVKIFKKGGKIIKKPYKVVIKKTLTPRGAKKSQLTEQKLYSAHSYMEVDPSIQLKKLRRRPIERELFSTDQQTNQKRSTARKQPVYLTQNGQNCENSNQFHQESYFGVDSQQTIGQGGQNHIHHHHYYILNQSPLFQTFNLKDGPTERGQLRQSSQFSARSRNDFEYQPDQISIQFNQGRYQQNNSLSSPQRRQKQPGTRDQAGWSPRRMISASVCTDYRQNNNLPSVNSSVYGDLNSLSREEGRSQEGSLLNLINQNSKAGPQNQTCRQKATKKQLNKRNSVYLVPGTEKRKQMQPFQRDRSPLVHNRLTKSVSVQKSQTRTISSKKGGKQQKAQESDVPVVYDDQDQSSVHSLFCETFNAPRGIRLRPHEDLNENFGRKNSLERELTRPASPIQFKAPLKASQVILFEITKVKNHHNCQFMNPFERFHLLDSQLQDWQTKPESRKKLDQHSEVCQKSQILNVNRYLKVRRFLEKRQKRIWNTRISYAVRKEVACKRPRLAGKFIKKQSHGFIEPDETEVLNLVTIQPLKTSQKPKPTKEKVASKQDKPRKAPKEKLSKEAPSSSPTIGPKDKRKAKKKAKIQKTAAKKIPKAAQKKGKKKISQLLEQPQAPDSK